MRSGLSFGSRPTKPIPRPTWPARAGCQCMAVFIFKSGHCVNTAKPEGLWPFQVKDLTQKSVERQGFEFKNAVLPVQGMCVASIGPKRSVFDARMLFSVDFFCRHNTLPLGMSDCSELLESHSLCKGNLFNFLQV